MAENKNKEGFWSNLFINIIIPAVILSKGEKWLIAWGVLTEESSKPLYFFCIALLFPIIYGAYDLIKRRKWNIFSIFGTISVLLTGTIGLFELSRNWIIAKETGIPIILGLAVLISVWTSKPLAKVLLYNKTLLDVENLDNIIEQKQAQNKLKNSMNFATCLVASSFFLSGIIQFFLASYIFTEGASASEFNEQVGKMTWVAYLVVMLPCMIIMFGAMFKVFADLKKITGLELDDMLSKDLKEKN